METYTAFAIQKDMKRSKELIDEVKNWFIAKKIMNPEPEENSKFEIYYGGSGFKETTDDDWYGEVEFVNEPCELKHVLGWDLGIDFILPQKIICPTCKKNLIEGIDLATFYGDSNKKQNDEALFFLDSIQKGVKSYNSGIELLINCPSCKIGHLITSYDYNLDLVFTNCAIIFWNWPELKPPFIEMLMMKLGNQTIMINN